MTVGFALVTYLVGGPNLSLFKQFPLTPIIKVGPNIVFNKFPVFTSYIFLV